MRLSTTINFFIYDDDGSYRAYLEDLRHYAALGFRNLDAIFCSAGAPGSPPVSYTHLDVYKRQVLAPSTCSNASKITSRFSALMPQPESFTRKVNSACSFPPDFSSATRKSPR